MTQPAVQPPPEPPDSVMGLAIALSLGAAVSLGITRFAYGLLLPPMRSDLGWSYTLAGAMNTVNALGYLLGALVTPWLMRHARPQRLLLLGAVLASIFMGLSGFFTTAMPLLLQRLLAGVASAFVFIAGGLLAARLGSLQPGRGGLVLGLYYGGTGWGIVLSAWLVCRRCWQRRATSHTPGHGPSGHLRWPAVSPRPCWPGRRRSCRRQAFR